MEIPYAGRAIINDLHNGIEVIIPAKRNWFVLIYFGILTVFCLLMSVVAPLAVSSSNPSFFSVVFILIPLSIMFYSGSIWWWLIAGKEVVTATPGVLTITRKGTLIRAKSYDLTEARHFRSSDGASNYNYNYDLLKTGRNGPWIISKIGSINFDYGSDTIRFGDRLSDAEGNYIIQRLKDKKLIN